MTAPTIPQLTDYRVYEGGTLPRMTAHLYEYWLAGNGVFIRASRLGLDALVMVSPSEVRGLPLLEPYCRVRLPKLPMGVLLRIRDLSLEVCEHGRMYERLFHLWYIRDGEDRGWHLRVPPQQMTSTSVIPSDDGPESSYAKALIEVHSHHGMAAFFSTTDDKDEQGFRLYGVIGNIFHVPAFRLRVGVYGHFLDLDPSEVFEMPHSIVDGRYSFRELGA